MPVKKTKTTKKSSARAPKKRFHHHHFPMIPLGSWILFWFFVLVTILLSTVCFTNVLDTTGRYATSTATNGSLATRLALEAKVAELQAQGAKDGSCSPDSAAWNSDPADRTVNYRDPKTGVQMSLPYNFNWGEGKNPLYPYTATESEIHFGPAKASGDCILIRDSLLLIDVKSKSVNETRRELNAAQDVKPTNIKEQTVSGIQVLSYTINRGAGDEKNWIAFGRTNQYTIHSDGWLTDAEAIKIIQSLKVVK